MGKFLSLTRALDMTTSHRRLESATVPTASAWVILLTLCACSPAVPGWASSTPACAIRNGSAPNALACTCDVNVQCVQDEYCLAGSAEPCSYFPRCRSFHVDNFRACLRCDPDDDFQCAQCDSRSLLVNGVCRATRTLVALRPARYLDSDGNLQWLPTMFQNEDADDFGKAPYISSPPTQGFGVISAAFAVPGREPDHGVAGDDAFAGVTSGGGLFAFGHPLNGGRLPGWDTDLDKNIYDVDKPRLYSSGGDLIGEEDNAQHPPLANVKSMRNPLPHGLSSPGSDPLTSNQVGVREVVASSRAFAAIIDNKVTDQLRKSVVVAWGHPLYGGVLPTALRDVMTEEIRSNLASRDAKSGCGAYCGHVRSVYSTAHAFAAVLESRRVVVWGDADKGGSFNDIFGADALTQIDDDEAGDPDIGRVRDANPGDVASTDRAFAAVLTPKNAQADATNPIFHDGLVAWGDPNWGGRIPTAVEQYFKHVGASYTANRRRRILALHATSGGAFLAYGEDPVIEPTNFGTRRFVVVLWGAEDFGALPTDPQQLRSWRDDVMHDAKPGDGCPTDYGLASKTFECSNIYFPGDDGLSMGPEGFSFWLGEPVRKVVSCHSGFALLLESGHVVSWGGRAPQIDNFGNRETASFMSLRAHEDSRHLIHQHRARSLFAGPDDTFAAILTNGNAVYWYVFSFVVLQTTAA